MQKHWRPAVSRWGGMVAFTQSGIIGTGGLNLTANQTTSFKIPTPHRRCWLERIGLSAGGIAADADGTILATVNKRDNVAAANVALTAATSLESDFVATANKTYLVPILSTLEDGQRTFQEGDEVYVDIVNNSAAIDTQPTHTAFVLEWFLLD